MRVAAFALGLLALAFVIHLVVWRLRPGWQRISTLLAVLLGTLALVSLASLLAPPSLVAWLPASGAAWCQVALFHVSVSLAYTVLYSALEADSPSLCLVLYVSRSPGGRTRDELRELLARRPLIGDRLAAAQQGDLLQEDEAGRWVLSPKGVWLARCFALAQRLLGMEVGA